MIVSFDADVFGFFAAVVTVCRRCRRLGARFLRMLGRDFRKILGISRRLTSILKSERVKTIRIKS